MVTTDGEKVWTRADLFRVTFEASGNFVVCNACGIRERVPLTDECQKKSGTSPKRVMNRFSKKHEEEHIDGPARRRAAEDAKRAESVDENGKV